MMTTKFKGVLVAELDGEWCFTAPLSSEQQQYVRALGLTEGLLLRKDRMDLSGPNHVQIASNSRENVAGGN